MSNRTAPIQYVVSLGLLAVVWQLAIWTFSIPSYILPQPLAVALSLWRDHELLIGAAAFTFKNALLGGLAGCTLGLIIGLACAYSRTLRWLMSPYLTIFQSFPREALFPVFVIWFGFGAVTKVINAGLLSMFPMAVITLNGLLDTRGDYLQLVRGWGASRWQELFYCRLPNATSHLIGALKVCIPLALIGSVLGEFIGGSAGLGHLILSSGAAFRSDRIFAAVIILAIFGTSLVGLASFFQNRLLSRFIHDEEVVQ